MSNARRILEEFYAKVALGRLDELLEMYSGEPNVDTPLHGSVVGREAFAEYVRREREWLFDRQPGAELFSTIETPERMVVEYLVVLRKADQTVELPVAVVADRDGDRLSRVRVYHTTWMTRHMHTMRDPLLPVAEGLEEPKIVDRYMKALAEGNVEAVLELFADYGYVREPSGAEFKHVGREARRKFYEQALSGGGLALKHCSATFDGRRCAIEYVLDRWGRVELDPQPGVAVYELDAAGKLGAVRIYDDIAPPTNHST